MYSNNPHKRPKIRWVTNAPSTGKSTVLLIPEYNESKNTNLESRLTYFTRLADEHNEILDIVIIDDGSTDESLKRITTFFEQSPSNLYLVSVTPNSQKVGALYITALALADYEYIILSDFDTDLENLSAIRESYCLMDSDPQLMGCYFKMIPFDGKGLTFLFQKMEYSFARIYYKFHKSEQSVPVMPGAGCCFKRETLLKVYALHSGLRNGEDREATVIGLNLGLKTIYFKEILALTRPPITFLSLLTQRKRWYLGYLETLDKERYFYMRMILKLNKIGIRTLQDIIGICILLFLPLEFIAFGYINVRSTLLLCLCCYLTSIIYYFLLFASHPEETQEFRSKDKSLIFAYPLFWLSVSFLSWWRALLTLRKSRRIY